MSGSDRRLKIWNTSTEKCRRLFFGHCHWGRELAIKSDNRFLISAITGVLAMQPQILVFDEFSAQLYPRSRRQLIELLQILPLMALIATHELDLALEICDRTLVLSQGKVVFDRETVRVMSAPEFLQQHALESPLSYSRPYCLIKHSPVAKS